MSLFSFTHKYHKPKTQRRLDQGQLYIANVPGFGRVPGVQQTEKDDCGPECIGIVLRLLRGHQGVHDRHQLHNYCGYTPPPPPRPGQVYTGSTRGQGLAMEAVKDGCVNAGLNSAKYDYTSDMHALLQYASFRNPYILNVQWELGGAHYIVCCGYRRSSKGEPEYCFSDPYYGVLAMPIPNKPTGGSVQPSYVVPTSRRGGERGFINKYWYISVA